MKMAQKGNMLEGEEEKKSIPPNRHGKIAHTRKGKKVAKPSKVTKEMDADRMSFQAIAIRHSGQWNIAEYVGGDEIVVYMAKEELCHSNLMREVHEQLDEDGRSTYMLFYTSTTDEGRKIKVALKADSDLNRLISEQKRYSIVYVIEKGKQSAAAGPHNEVGYYDSQRSTVLPIEMDARRSIMIHDDRNDKSSWPEEESDSSDEEEEERRRREILDSVTTEHEAWRQTRPHNFTSEHHLGVEPRGGVEQAGPELRNWEIPLLDFDVAPPLGWEEPNVPESGILSVGALFRTKDELTTAVRLYHMENHVEYVVDRSNKTRVWFVCKHGNDCPFKLRAVQNASIWRVIKLVKDHTCHTDLNRTAPRRI